MLSNRTNIDDLNCCIFWPAFLCSEHKTLVDISFSVVFVCPQDFDAKMMKNEAKISVLCLIPKQWSTQKCWSSILKNVFRSKTLWWTCKNTYYVDTKSTPFLLFVCEHFILTVFRVLDQQFCVENKAKNALVASFFIIFFTIILQKCAKTHGIRRFQPLFGMHCTKRLIKI